MTITLHFTARPQPSPAPDGEPIANRDTLPDVRTATADNAPVLPVEGIGNGTLTGVTVSNPRLMTIPNPEVRPSDVEPFDRALPLSGNAMTSGSSDSSNPTPPPDHP